MTTDHWIGLYVIRHKASGEYMPLYRRGKGYSHWHPGSSNIVAAENMGIPRILKSRKQAIKVARLWASQPNLEMKFRGTIHGDETYLGSTKDDRKLEDIEILPIELHFGVGEDVKK